MSDGKRPGGLTALAVLNFVFGGFGVLGLLAIFAVLGGTVHDGERTSPLAAHGSAILWLDLLLALVVVGLMIASGVGYLGLKRFLGRTLGNAYAIGSLVSSVVGISLAGFGLMNLVGLVYPILTLALLNTTFKDDLVN